VDPPVEKSPEEVRAEAKERLGPHREKFDVETRIEQLGKRPASPDGRYRFVVMGDSRSNPDLWPNIVKHIDRLDPRPAFVISTGDIVVHGYTDEYVDYYIPPLLQTDIRLVAAGNHDDGDDGLAVEYQALFGPRSLNYYFDYGRRRFILIDNVTEVLPPDATLVVEAGARETPPGAVGRRGGPQPPSTVEKWAYHSWDEEPSRSFSDLMSRYKVEHVFWATSMATRPPAW
jgi:hypothetical protein